MLCIPYSRAKEDYEFQAAVFYADHSEPKEEHFVQSKLLVYLENTWKYKTFVPQRDYLIGSSKLVVIYVL